MITPEQIRNSAKFGSPLRAEVLLELADRLEKLEAAPKWVGLTDEEVYNALPGYPIDYKLEFYRAIEAKLKEKNR